MPVSVTPYDPVKIDKLRHLLEDMAGKGMARPYEIFVDNLKVTPKTESVEAFDSYEFYMGEDTEKIRIVIYDSPSSPRNNQYVFTLKAAPEPALNGLGNLDGIIQEKLDGQQRQFELGRLKEELEQTKQSLKESEEYAEMLEGQLEEVKTNRYKLGNLDLVELGGVLLENLAKKNSGLLGKIGLAGIDEEYTALPEESAPVSFKRKNAATTEPEMERYAAYAPFIDSLENTFSPDQLSVLLQVIDKLGKAPDQLPAVVQLLNIQSS